MNKILSIETSCDDTSVAIVNSDYNVLSNIVSSQIKHEEFGGVVPELASRLHMKNIMPVCKLALETSGCEASELDAIAVSVNPGLIGALLVGLSFAKSFAYILDRPLIAVNHMVGHIYAVKLDHPELQPPFLTLVVSGGHTELVMVNSWQDFNVVGKTYDDAAGEAFDKTAKLMGLGYPGGPIIDKLARQGDGEFVDFPRALANKKIYDFSFSGLKTAVRNYLNTKSEQYIKDNVSNITASVQAAIVDSLIRKTMLYAKKHNVKQIVLAGGVAANSKLRSELFDQADRAGIKCFMPRIAYCMDNAAMIAAAAIDKYERKEFAPLDLNACPQKGVRYL
jgi:N6-L-threonylcarbamoyladenine synthase